ncbi:11062_t:CDS:2, partial [Racocetra persica]
TLEFDGFYDLKKYSLADYVIPRNRSSIKHLSCRADLSSIHPFNATKADTLGIIIQIANKNLTKFNVRWYTPSEDTSPYYKSEIQTIHDED